MADIMPAQADLLTYGFSLIAVLVAAVLLYSFFAKRLKKSDRKLSRGRKTRVASDQSDRFFNPLGDGVVNDEQPQEFRLLVEEQRVVESIAGSENLEIQWRHATLREAKAVVTQYHKYLSDNSLVKSGLDMGPRCRCQSKWGRNIMGCTILTTHLRPHYLQGSTPPLMSRRSLN